MVTVTVQGAIEPLCCWLRPAPPDLTISVHCTYNQILEAVRLQQWFPLNCHYCNYRPKHVDDYERHVIKNHQRKPAYPGPTPENIARVLYIIKSIERELIETKGRRRAVISHSRQTAQAASPWATKHDLYQQEIIVKQPTRASKKYLSFELDDPSGEVWCTSNSPNFVTGKVALTARGNGSYPYKFHELIEELFGKLGPNQRAIEVCSGTVKASSNLDTVDINPDKNPRFCLDGQKLPTSWSNAYERFFCDPPYNEKNAAKMYGTTIPSWTTLLREGARVVKPGGLLFLLLPSNMQGDFPSITKIGSIVISVIPNNELRCLNIYRKHSF